MEKLTPIELQFILHWGEMGTRWGINRTVAQVHALLHISPRPLNAEEIAAVLGVARSNVSTSLKELLGWRIVKLVHVMGDKRDYFCALSDVWETFRIVMDERKKREFDPTLALLNECIENLKHEKQTGKHTKQKLRELAGFFETASTCYDEIARWPTSALKNGARLISKFQKLIGLAK